MNDDELLTALSDALSEPMPEPDPARIEAIRAAAAARRDAIPTGPLPAADDGPTSLRDARPARSARRSTPRRLAWAAAAAAVLVVAIVIATVASNDGGSSGQVEYAGPITGDSYAGELTVTKTGIGRVVDLDTNDLPILPTGEFYAVWFVGKGDTAASPNRISAGTFHPDEAGRTHVTLAAAVDPAKYPVVQITSEPGDGNPAPSTIVVLEVTIL